MRTHYRPRSKPSFQSGLSMVELMVAVAIGLFLVLAISVLIVRQSNTRDELDKSSQLIENGRYATQLLTSDIEHAGFYATYAPPITTTYTAPSDPCSTALSNQGWGASPLTVPVPIYGYAGASTNPTPSTSTCATLISNYKPGTAILVVRRTGTVAVAATAAASGTGYLQVSQCSTDTAPFVFDTAGFTLNKKDCTTKGDLLPWIVRVYYLSSCDVCSPSSDNIPTLKVIEFTGGTQTTFALVEGIENMQFDYGIAASSTSLSPASYTTSPATTSDWSNVVSVRINLLVRNISATAGYTDTKSYTLGGFGSVTPGGAYKRHVFSQAVRVINVSERRE